MRRRCVCFGISASRVAATFSDSVIERQDGGHPVMIRTANLEQDMDDVESPTIIFKFA